MQHKQLVTIAALTESSSGKTMNMSRATPTVWRLSIRMMKRKCDRCGVFHDLKKQIRAARINAPISGIENAIKSAHIHATRSSSGRTETKDLSRSWEKFSDQYCVRKLSADAYQFFVAILKFSVSPQLRRHE